MKYAAYVLQVPSGLFYTGEAYSNWGPLHKAYLFDTKKKAMETKRALKRFPAAVHKIAVVGG